MNQLTMPELAQKIRDIDLVMFSTKTEKGEIAARPMSNNGDVEYDGDSYFFAMDGSRTVADVEQDKLVSLSLQGKAGLLGKPPIFVAIQGAAELIREKAAFEAHWTSDLDRWAPQGSDTPGLVLIKVRASRIHYWDGQDEGEIVV